MCIVYAIFVLLHSRIETEIGVSLFVFYVHVPLQTALFDSRPSCVRSIYYA